MTELLLVKLRRDFCIRFIDTLNTLMEQAENNPAKAIEARLQYRLLPDRIRDFETFHAQLMVHPENASKQDDLFLEYDDFNAMVREIQVKFENSPLHTELNQSQPIPYDSLNTGFISQASQSQSYARLPKLNLPTFTGNVSDWNSFYDIFNSAIHDNDTLKPVQKFQYLKLILKGEPFALVKNLTLTDDNYVIARKLLEDRYSHKRLISSHHLQVLIDMPRLTSLTYKNATTFVASINEHTEALKANQEPVDSWDSLLAFIFITKIDTDTRNKFECTLSRDTLPTLAQLLNFLNKFIQSQQWQFDNQVQTPFVRENSKQLNSKSSNSNSNRSFRTSTLVSTTTPQSCAACSQNHKIMQCAKFQAMDTLARFNLARVKHLCRNCLSSLHASTECLSKTNCKRCNKRHHTMLHFTNNPAVSNAPPVQQTVDQATSSNSASDNFENSTVVETQTTCLTSHKLLVPYVLLGTAIVLASDSAGTWKPVRALLDSGSEASYITHACAERLKLSSRQTDIAVSGFGSTTVNNVVKGITTIKIRSLYHESPVHSLSTIIVTNITRNLPKRQLPSEMLTHFSHLQLADPDFITPAPIELLIGADMYFDILTGQKLHYKNYPIALETTLGWIISGSIASSTLSRVNTLLTSHDHISENLTKFWELEEIPNQHILSDEDRLAEQIFQDHHERVSSGRYIVPLLFKHFPVNLGHSYSNALHCYSSLQRRLRSDPKLHLEYNNFMKDYLDQHHMSPLNPELNNSNEGFYLPHHGVLREANSTTKLRVVFNGSKKTTTNTSLNENLLTGAALQSNLTSIIIRSRFHKVIFTADIRQMYRQILISEDHRKYQKILWSFDLNKPPKTYVLNTVTYGTTCAPFLAIRTLIQLAEDERINFPSASKILNSDTYVDDIITGANSLSEALELQSELIKLLETANLELRKWTSNHPEILSTIPAEYREFSFSYGESDSVKILGLIWNPSEDYFTYKISLPNHVCTKRTILSDIAKIFDPIGWLSPIIMVAKRLMQELWIHGINWDADVPTEISSRWNIFKDQLSDLSAINIPRYIDVTNASLTLIGFCDASEAGYAAVAYIRAEYFTCKSTKTFLICAKTKVAPTKRVSLPRLELCAAVLLSRLISNLVQSTNLNFSQIYAWSDSTIALSWIRSPPYRWKTFVSNRVSEIQQHIPPNCWHHVRSHENPADCASRGITTKEFLSHPLWFTGPSWLQHPLSFWPLDQQSTHIAPSSQAREEEKLILIAEIDQNNNLLFRYSQLDQLLRITVLCLRFFKRLHRQEISHDSFITASEFNEALMRWTKLTQQEVFSKEIDQLSRGELCSKPIQQLSPFIDSNGLLRVGGRLRNSKLNYDQKHPLLLPSKHRFTHLVIDYFHKKYLHPSPRTLHAILNRQFWILAARRVIRSYSSKCTTCFRCRPTGPTPPMGDLPDHRVIQLKPFGVVGVDYGGPFYVTPVKKRGYKATKAYLCLFVCFSTKALHLELASDLTTEAFILAFRRFLARRGRCSHIYSDSGTNFVGTKSYFTEMQKFVASTDYNLHLANKLASDGIQWHLNPPSAPHFGGLWEAGIKSVKFHLSRVVGSQVFTCEEFSTVLCQVESILNSRPLCPLSSDPNDLHALTPNHFLLLEPGVCLPDRDYIQEPDHHLTRWQLVQRTQQDFWKRWHQEYVNTLQQRTKWTSSTPNLEPNQLVLIKDALLPPLQWKFGRIIDVHPGRDGVVRVAQVKTASGVFTRPVVKLCPLPHT